MKGYFTIPYDYLANRNLSDDFWTIRAGKADVSLRAAIEPHQQGGLIASDAIGSPIEIYSSRSILMAPLGQTAAQMPHPLQ